MKTVKASERYFQGPKYISLNPEIENDKPLKFNIFQSNGYEQCRDSHYADVRGN